MTERRALLEKAAEHAQQYLDTVNERPVRASATSQELNERLSSALGEEGEDPLRVLEEIADAAKVGTVATSSAPIPTLIVAQ